MLLVVGIPLHIVLLILSFQTDVLTSSEHSTVPHGSDELQVMRDLMNGIESKTRSYLLHLVLRFHVSIRHRH